MQPINLKAIARDAALRGDTKTLFHTLDLLEQLMPIAALGLLHRTRGNPPVRGAPTAARSRREAGSGGGLVSMIPRSHYIGKRLGDPPKDEAEHFIRCPACDGWIDCRDLGQVFQHEGLLPHPAQDQSQ